MKKILFTLHLPPPIHGSSILSEHIKNSEVINSKYQTTYYNLTSSKEISDMQKGIIKKILKIVRLIYMIHKECIKSKFSLFYSAISPYGMAFFRDSVIILSLKVYRKPIIIHLHGKGIKDEVSKSKLLSWYYKLVFKNAKVIHNSPLLYHDIEKIVLREDVFFVANGTIPINLDSSKMGANNDENSNLILFLSNLEETKGPLVLLEAAKLLRDKKVDFKVVFAGQWSSDLNFKMRFEEFINDNDLSKNAEYVGPKYGNEKVKLFKNASIFVLPTFYRNECFPVSILEAMSASLPIISTNEGAIKEIVDDGVTGFIVRKKDPKILAQKIEYLLSDEKTAKRMGKAGNEKYFSNYTVEQYCNRIDNVIGQEI